MATITLTKCDGCGKDQREKGKDQWLKIGVSADPARRTLGAIDEATERLDLCGHACFHKKIDELLKLRGLGRPRGSKNKPAPITVAA